MTTNFKAPETRELSHPLATLATELHNSLCRYNHTDGCGWYYEIHNGVDDWSGWAHDQYLVKAVKVSEAAPDNLSIEALIEIVKEIHR